MYSEENALGEAIHQARIGKKLTQEQLAEMLDITPGHLQHIESGRRKPSVPMLFSMMKLLEFSVDALVFPKQNCGRLVDLRGIPEHQAAALRNLIEALK